MFEGIIDYADGTQSSVTADSVELGFEDNGNTEVVSIKFRDDTYTYKFAIPEAWWDEGDGSELSAEDLEALRGQDTEMTHSISMRLLICTMTVIYFHFLARMLG